MRTTLPFNADTRVPLEVAKNVTRSAAHDNPAKPYLVESSLIGSFDLMMQIVYGSGVVT